MVNTYICFENATRALDAKKEYLGTTKYKIRTDCKFIWLLFLFLFDDKIFILSIKDNFSAFCFVTLNFNWA